MKPTRFVKLVDLIREITEEEYFTLNKLQQMYEKYAETGQVEIEEEKIKDERIKEEGKVKKEIRGIIIDYFWRIKYNENDARVSSEYDDSVKRLGLLNLKEWKQLIGKEIIEEDIVNTYVPQITITPIDIYLAINESGRRTKFTLNPHLEQKKENKISPDVSLQRVKIKVMRQMKNVTKMETFNLTYKKYFICSRCGKTHYLYPYQANQLLKCRCVKTNKTDKNGEQIILYHTTSKEGIRNETYPIYLYEIGVGWNKVETYYMYSMEKLRKGAKYIADIAMLDLEIEEKVSKIPIVLGTKEKEREKIDEKIFTEIKAEAETGIKEKKIPNLKIIEVMYAVRRIIQKYGYIRINNRGYLLQMCMIISAIAKQRYKFNKLAISVVGNSGLSKTYIGETFTKVLDIDGIVIGNGKNLTYNGIIGGVNTGGVAVGGNKVSVFEEGIATRGGLVVLDEASVYYSDPDINSSLKNFLDKSIIIAKTGAPKEEIANNYTPVILCNFPSHKTEYIRKVKDYYKKFIRKYPVEAHQTDERSVEKYLSEVNYFMPEQYYIESMKNQTLGRAISYVRKVIYNNPQAEIDWRTGGTIPAANRVMFDIVCNNENEERVTKREIPESPVIPDKDDFPTEEIVEVLKKWRKKKEINLIDASMNSEEVNNQVYVLKERIYEFLTEDERGEKIYTAIAWGDKGKRVDARLEGLVYTTILTMQLFEDEDSVEISEEVKELAYLILTKVKRGISEEEYNFKKHITNIENIEYDMKELEIIIQEIEGEEKIEEIARIEKAKEKKSNLEVIEELDDIGEIK